MHLSLAGQAVQIITGPGMPSPANTTVSFGGNPIMMHAHCALIFYGGAWQSASPSPVQVQSAVQTILQSPYCSLLSDYSCSGGDMDTAWNRIVLDAPPDPFSQGDAEDVVEDLIDDFYSTFPTFNRPSYYSVLLPPGVKLDQAGLNGEHSNDGGVYFSYQKFGNLDFITQVFTHELVEALTDPDGGGWQVEPRNSTSWNEIADICQNTFGRVNGVAASAYYSTSTGACVVPLPDPPPPPPPTLPNGEYQITCATLTSYKGSPYLWAVGGTLDGKSWIMLVQQAVKRVKSGELKLYTLEDGLKATVSVGVSRTNHEYLTTSPDSTKANNLDVIAKNHPCTEPDDGMFWQ